MFGITSKFENAPLVKGLYFYENTEMIPDEALSECDGFICYEGVLKKDHALVLCEDLVNNAAYFAAANLPICPADSEVDPEDQEDPPEPEEDVEEYDPDDYEWSYILAWVSGQMTSMGSNETKYLEVTGNVGETFWSVDLSGFTGTLEHKKVSNVKSVYKTSSDASGSFTVIVHDAFNDLSRTIAVTSGVTFGIEAILGETQYWLTFDQNLEYLGAVQYSNYSEKSRIDEGIYTYYLELSPPGPPEYSYTGIKKSGAFLLGPYTAVSDGGYSGQMIFSRLPPNYPFQGSVNGHSLIFYYFINFDDSTIKYYIMINDDSTLLLDSVPDGDTLGGITLAYSDSASLLVFGTGYSESSYSYYLLAIVDAEGNYKTKDLTSGYRYYWDGEDSHYYLTIGGVEYEIGTFLRVIQEA